MLEQVGEALCLHNDMFSNLAARITDGLAATLSIRGRILVFAGFTLIGLAAIGAIQRLTEASFEEAIRGSREVTALQARASALNARVADLRALHRDYAISRSDHAASLFEAKALAAQLEFERLKKSGVGGRDVDSALDSIIERLAKVMAEFELIRARQRFLGANATEGLHARLEDRASAIEQLMGSNA
ncbi:MAG: hypothetical protein ABWZ80_05210, partial [Beijerinckiaceae bacterium]